MSKNTTLTYFDCAQNRLTTEGLNTLFGTLPGNAGDKIIYTGGSNPGSDDCDKSTAEGKGWTVK